MRVIDIHNMLSEDEKQEMRMLLLGADISIQNTEKTEEDLQAEAHRRVGKWLGDIQKSQNKHK